MVAGDVHKLVLVALFGWCSSESAGLQAEREPNSRGDLWVPTHNVRLSPCLEGALLFNGRFPLSYRRDRPGNAQKEFHDRAAATASFSSLPFTMSLLGWLIYQGQLTMSSFCL